MVVKPENDNRVTIVRSGAQIQRSIVAAPADEGEADVRYAALILNGRCGEQIREKQPVPLAPPRLIDL